MGMMQIGMTDRHFGCQSKNSYAAAGVPTTAV
jgi:hypothetical protein